MTRKTLLAAAFLTALACAGGGVRKDDLLARAGVGRPRLSNDTIVAGLKEALEVGTRSAVTRTSRVDGYFDNPLIHIGLPDSLDPLAKGLRAIGFGRKVDELELAMNRAAERAAGEATDVFWSAIRQMTFADARAILRGGDTAATDYFDRTTRDELRGRFEPIVSEKMEQVGLVRLYDDLVARYAALPLTRKPPLDMGSYVTERALDGLFAILADEERKIRADPAARTTDLLRRVFGS